MNVEISTDPNRLDMALIHHCLSESAYWAIGRPREVVQRAFDNSLCFGAYHDGRLVGFARVVTDYATFGWLADVFVVEAYRGQGVGKALLGALLQAAEAAGFRQVYAVIGGAEPASIALHAALGFIHAGMLRGSGRKHGRWLDTTFMQIAVGGGDTTPPDQEP